MPQSVITTFLPPTHPLLPGVLAIVARARPQLTAEEKAAKDVDDEIVEVDPADTSMEDASDRVCMLKNYVHLVSIRRASI